LSISKIGDLEVGHVDGASAREMRHDNSLTCVMRGGRNTESAGNGVYAGVLLHFRRIVLEHSSTVVDDHNINSVSEGGRE
jgi:hypothetical protein